jgi:hypothetical protein
MGLHSHSQPHELSPRGKRIAIEVGIVLIAVLGLPLLVLVVLIAANPPASAHPAAAAAASATATPLPTSSSPFSVVIARDNQRLVDQPQDVQDQFQLAYGDQAGAEWAREHNACLPDCGAPPLRASTAAPAPKPVLAATPVPPTPSPSATKPKVGSTVAKDGWQIKLVDLKTVDSIKQSGIKTQLPQGKYVIATIAATNLQKTTSTLNLWDLSMVDGTGTKYSSSNSGNSALEFSNFEPKTAPPVMSFEQVQPGLTDTFRIVFDVNPASSGYTLNVANIPFNVAIA